MHLPPLFPLIFFFFFHNFSCGKFAEWVQASIALLSWEWLQDNEATPASWNGCWHIIKGPRGGPVQAHWRIDLPGKRLWERWSTFYTPRIFFCSWLLLKENKNYISAIQTEEDRQTSKLKTFTTPETVIKKEIRDMDLGNDNASCQLEIFWLKSK